MSAEKHSQASAKATAALCAVRMHLEGSIEVAQASIAQIFEGKHLELQWLLQLRPTQHGHEHPHLGEEVVHLEGLLVIKRSLGSSTVGAISLPRAHGVAEVWQSEV